jgi:hypothetical protein
MPLQRQTTYINPKYKKKMTTNRKISAYKKRGAYGKKAKKQFKNARRPFVEGKRRSLEDVVEDFGVYSTDINPQGVRNPMALDTTPGFKSYGLSYLGLDDAFTGFHPVSFLQQRQGLGDDQMVGSSIYVKYIKQKMQFQFPLEPAQALPINLYLVHGWFKTPLNRTTRTPTTLAQTNSTNISDHMNERLLDYFNEKTDKLRFIPASVHNDIKILGYRKVKPNRNASISIQQAMLTSSTEGGDPGSVGSVPNVNMSCTWSVNRKVHYTKGVENTPTPAQYFPNTSWLPFCVVYNPDFESYSANLTNPERGSVRILSNNMTWYSDS